MFDVGTMSLILARVATIIETVVGLQYLTFVWKIITTANIYWKLIIFQKKVVLNMSQNCFIYQ